MRVCKIISISDMKFYCCRFYATFVIFCLVSDFPQYSQMLLTVCETIHNEAIVLLDQTHHALTTDSALFDDKDSMETDCAPRLQHKDQKDGVRGENCLIIYPAEG